LASAELYNPATGIFTAIGSLTLARTRHTATLLPTGKVLFSGGETGTDTGSNGFASAELYDPLAGTFIATGSLAVPRVFHTATLLPNGTVLVAGGSTDGSGNNTPVSTELYDPASAAFTATAALGIGRVTHTATLLSNGKVLVAAG